MAMKKRTSGRPAKPPGEKYERPGRRLGRGGDEEWAEMQAGGGGAGKSFTEWAMAILLRAARRQR